MYSQCPECQTRFRVTAFALRAAHGTVRCGRCSSAFDALPRLTDTLNEPRSSLLATDALDSDSAAELDDDASAGTADGDDEGALMTEFHFSANDIEQVVIDA